MTKLYHFCAKRMLFNIKKEGLTLGAIPVLKDGKFAVMNGWQWLTSNEDFDQSWNKHSTLPYKRNDYRIEINIPKDHHKNLIYWLDASKMPELKESAAILNSHGDPKNWWIFKGRIKPGWFKEVVKNQNLLPGE